MRKHIVVNGLAVDAVLSPVVVEDRLLPLLGSMSPHPGAARSFAFLAGPPGCGKSTLAELLRHAAAFRGLDLAVVGIDGFHHMNDYLARHTAHVNGKDVRLVDVKGAPESFDLDRLRTCITRSATEDVAWPGYDRRLHEPVDDRTAVTAGRVLVEGNWLLLEEPGWRDLRALASLTIFIDAGPPLLRERLIARKQAGGISLHDAETFYEASDLPNIIRYLDHSARNVDVTLTLRPDGHLEEVTS
ncbi:AAA family ATPase [Raineyella sp. W15-4]|uniref:AAA family ATPase n=1 Tax=Raineyella sp. W15-4 TaxID=3081651 RepID=UPI002953E04C|nr:AAA family ATPase [Raineyella sp. W15-4]WOQ17359.1 hypothetical protein R0145_01200 [Raineyella sp. W15-4]